MSVADDNREYVALAANSSTGAAQSLKVDPVTGFLLIQIKSITADPTLPSTKTDENREGAAEAVDDNGVIRPLLADSDGNLLCDIEVV